MRKRPLDMIPFVDIMIAVLFIFATIEEGDSGAVAKAEELKKENEQLKARLAETQAIRTKLALEISELQGAVAAGKQTIDAGLESNRKREVMDALLGEAQVIEIEIEGKPLAEDTVNPCCFRRFANDAPWKSCGDVPTAADERGRWLDDGAGGLLAELNKTGATPTMVLIRQEQDAAYNISDKLGQQVRERTPIKKTYSVTVPTPVEHCAK